MERRTFLKLAGASPFTLDTILRGSNVSAQELPMKEATEEAYLDRLATWELGSGEHFTGINIGDARGSGYTTTETGGQKLLYRVTNKGIECFEKTPNGVNFLGNVRLRYNGEDVRVGTLAPIAFTNLLDNDNGLDEAIINNPNISSYLVFKQESPLLWNYVDMLKIHDESDEKIHYRSIVFDGDTGICGTRYGTSPVIEKDDGLNMRLKGFLINNETGERLRHGTYNVPTVMEIDGKKYLFSSEADSGNIIMAQQVDDLSYSNIGNVVDANGNIPHNFVRLVTINNGNGLVDGKRILLLGDGWAGFSYLTQDIPGPVSVEEQKPSQFQLYQNHPNPFNPNTTIEYDLQNAQPVELEIINTAGQTVRKLYSGNQEAGHHVTKWDGRTDGGLYVPSGVYFTRLRAGNQVQTKKMMLLK